MKKNTVLLVAGISTLIQASLQFVLCGLAVAQYLCLFDLLLELPLLLYIRILYFHNPTCEIRVNVGQAIDGMADQAFVLLTRESMPTFRTFVTNAVYLGLSVVWVVTSLVLIQAGSTNSRSVHVRWPWMLVMVVTFVLDICATVAYITDTFQTRTLTQLVGWVGGTVSGAGSQLVDTSMAAWLMVMLYSRFVVTIFFNVFLVICVLVECGNRAEYDDDQEGMKEFDETSYIDTAIPRVSILRRMPTWLSSVSRSTAPRVDRPPSPDPLPDTPSPPPGAPPLPLPPPLADSDRKHTVNFPENLLSLPQRLENMIAEQQRRLDAAVVDTAGGARPAAHPGATTGQRVSQSLPQLHQPKNDNRGRRGTAVELQGQLPWSYMPPAPHHMRDQLPPDEELPPVPVPDYTLHPTYRKASVHRAGSSVSATQFTHTSRRDMNSSPLPRYLVFPF